MVKPALKFPLKFEHFRVKVNLYLFRDQHPWCNCSLCLSAAVKNLIIRWIALFTFRATDPTLSFTCFANRGLSLYKTALNPCFSNSPV